MAKITLISNDIWRELKRICKPKHIEANSLPFSVVLDVDANAYKAVDKDPLLQAKLTDAASAQYKKYMVAMVKELKKSDAALGKTTSKKEGDKIIKDLDKFFDTESAKFSSLGAKAANAVWADVAKSNAEYRKYKFKAGVNLGVDSLNLVGGVAGTVGSGGFALIVTVYGIVKTLISMAMQVYKLAIDADKMQKRVTKNLKAIQKSFDKKRKEISGAKDTGKAFVNSLLGADFIPTLKSVKGDNEQYGKKLLGVDKGSHALAVKLNQVLKKMDSISAMPEIKKNKKINAAMKKFQAATSKLIDKIIDMQAKVSEGEKFQAKTAAAIKELETLNPKKWKYIQKGFVVTDIVLAGGDFKAVGATLLGIGTAIATEADKAMLDEI